LEKYVVNSFEEFFSKIEKEKIIKILMVSSERS
jgi:hypothetical protein